MTVWKFQLGTVSAVQYVTMPHGAEIIHAQMQDGIPCFWAIVNPEATKIKRCFVIVGTGHDLGGFGEKHIQSFQDGAFMWHLFETDF